jgi:hypothetical protein
MVTDEIWWLLTTWQTLGVCCCVKRCSKIWETIPPIVIVSRFLVDYAHGWLFNIAFFTAYIFAKLVVMIGFSIILNALSNTVTICNQL